MAEKDDLLDSLLMLASEELENLEEPPKLQKSLTETDIFQTSSNIPDKKQSSTKGKNSNIHSGDTDSSDDEGNRNYENKKYSEYGSEIKHLLDDNTPSISPSFYGKPKQRISTWKHNPNTPNKPKTAFNAFPKLEKTPQDVFIDPVFGMRIVTPLINSAVLLDRMEGREAVQFSRLNLFIQMGTKNKDWVICGVIANKTAPKTSQKGTQYSIWTLTDLKDDIRTVSLFLFKGAYKDLWKTATGTVIGVLNPNVMDKKDGSKDEATLSVDNAQKVMIFGHSKDFGTCKSTKKNGDKCTAIVNLNKCEYCVYHIKQEYQKCSKRSELQANFVGKGLTALQNKLLGKNEVIYGAKSYMAIPAKRSKTLERKDERLLQGLSGKSNLVLKNGDTKSKSAAIRKQNATCLEVSQSQRLKDLEILKKLEGKSVSSGENCNINTAKSENVTAEESKSNALSVIHKLKQKSRVARDNHKKPVSGQYNLKSDLILNLEGKKNFDAKLSENVTLEDSKSTALNVIAKLKAKKHSMENEQKKTNDEHIEQFENNEMFEEFDLNYDDMVDSSKTKSNNGQTNTKINTTPTQKEKISTQTTSTMSCSASLHTKSPSFSNLSLSKFQDQFPKLSSGSNNFIDLNKPVVKRRCDKTKENAISFIKKMGPIKKSDPNNTKGTGLAKKRFIEDGAVADHPAKKSKLQESEFISDRFKKMMAATSSHTDLLEIHDNEEKEKYFQKLEAKEQMEEKMVNTYKIACKAVRCLQCKYTSFSAADRCKAERHPLKVFDSMKRFFKCGNCQNRTVSLDVIPTVPCKNCGSGKWERTGMMKEKSAVTQHHLSIRGGEQKFVNSVATDANINLLVPEDGA